MRPQPPADLVETHPHTFHPDSDLRDWVYETFIEDGGLLANETHRHLQHAAVAFVWTNVESKSCGRIILGQCEMIQDSGSLWAKARGLHLLRTWFGEAPDFLVTLYAPACSEMSDRQFFALIEHEIMHAGQKRDMYGNPCFSTQTGEPLFAMRGHDVEEFVGVVDRYGATSTALTVMAESIAAGPLIADEEITIVCGACA